MAADDDDRTVRGRLADLDFAPDPGRPADPPLSLVGKTRTISAYPTTAKAWYGIDTNSISGDEAEGAAATFAGRSEPALRALNLGSNIPPVGTVVRVDREAGGRWVFTY